jgi:transposase
MPRPRKYPDELIARGVRLAIESGRPVRHVGDDLGIHHEMLRRHVRQAEAGGGLRPDLPTSQERATVGNFSRGTLVQPASPPSASTAPPAANEHLGSQTPAGMSQEIPPRAADPKWEEVAQEDHPPTQRSSRWPASRQRADDAPLTEPAGQYLRRR